MSVAKVIKVTATSTESFDDAVKAGIKKSGESLQGIEAVGVRAEGGRGGREDRRLPRHAANHVHPRVTARAGKR